jgi:hypothetical protein
MRDLEQGPQVALLHSQKWCRLLAQSQGRLGRCSKKLPLVLFRCNSMIPSGLLVARI